MFKHPIIKSVEQIFKQYLKNISKAYRQGDAREETYYPYLKDFIDAYAEFNYKALGVTVLPKKSAAGIPDFLIRGQHNKIIGYIEAKDPNIRHLAGIADSEQLKRYRESLPNIILTNFIDFQLFRNGELIKEVALPNPSAIVKMNLVVPPSYLKNLITLLEEFLSVPTLHTKRAVPLATELAKRTKFLNDLVLEELKRDNPDLKGFFNAFQKELIDSLTEDKFADMYAQTITYGLFTARIRAGRKKFTRQTAYEFIPPTISLLKNLFYFIIGPTFPQSLEWIIDDIIGVLADADLSLILKDFHTEKWTKDPVIHFYETFLEVYNPKERAKLGVYYTPEPVVSYIVHSIHNILKEKLNKPKGLADGTVTLLDPAGGTLTFPAMAIRLACEEVKDMGTGYLKPFIKEHILRNFYAFEILVAPYAIGHFKISVVLEDLGYKLQKDERFNLYLTNTLEMKTPPLTGFIPGLNEETKLAKRVKDEVPVLVITGNPPYSVSSENKSDFIEDLMKSYKEDVSGERNLQPLSDDYIKFIRFAQWRLEKTGQGVIGIITNNSYLSGLIHRGMRKKLFGAFDEIYILNLHGNARIGEVAPDGSKDRNVFDIMQGVSIALFVKLPNKQEAQRHPVVYYSDLYGTREKKYEYLLEHNIKNTKWQKLRPVAPHYFFVPKDFTGEVKYQKFWALTDIFKEFNSGVKTHRDHFVVGFSEQELKNRLLQFTGPQPDEMLAQAFELKDTRDWNLSEARKKIKEEDYLNKIYPFTYRIFDIRFICYSQSLIERGCDRLELMQHLLHPNLALVTTKQLASLPFNHAFITEGISDMCLISLKTKETSYICPLYLYDNDKPDNNKKGGLSTPMMLFDKGKDKYEVRHSNFKPEFINAIKKAFGKLPSPEEILYYIYGVLYSPTYRKKYEEFLKIDFPRIPLIKDYKVFKKMSGWGKELVELHLLKSSVLEKGISKLSGEGDNKISKIAYNEKAHRININKKQYFTNVAPKVWNYFIGGYQVLDKYLKSRKERKFSRGEIEHYLRIVTAVNQTLSLQSKIDKIYPEIEKSIK